MTIDRAGRLVLPKPVRDELEIKAGDSLRLALEGYLVTLRPNRASAGLVRKGRALVFRSASTPGLDADAVRRLIGEARRQQFTPPDRRFRAHFSNRVTSAASCVGGWQAVPVQT